MPLEPDEVIAEFDQWVTPKLGDIRSTQKFQDELSAMGGIVQHLAEAIIADGRDQLDAIGELLSATLGIDDINEAADALVALLSTLFLVTAKSDNAVKCQYPLHFRVAHGDSFPVPRSGQLRTRRAPDVLKADDLIRVALATRVIDPAASLKLLRDYAEFLLQEPEDRRQLAALLEGFARTNAVAELSGSDLLAPLVAFQVRGSVAASGGHDPEQIVRDRLTSWGLVPGVHFNLSDVTATALSDWLADEGVDGFTVADRSDDKTRAFDFIFPYRRTDSVRRVFVQSQFYAGDSGSVSHKNVDQASKARAQAAEIFPDARFVELVDGAGYCASLRRDLRHLLFAADTDDFTQLRSIPVRLRRILQESGIVAPMDVAIRVCEGIDTASKMIAELVERFGESGEEHLNFAIEAGWLRVNEGDHLQILEAHRSIVDKYALLDQVIDTSGPLSASDDGAVVLVPGFGADYGAPMSDAWRSTSLEELNAEGALMVREVE